MRSHPAICFGVFLAGCAGEGDAGGTLTCKDRGKTFTVAVAPGTLADTRARAEAADFTDCDFEAGVIARAEPPRRELRVLDEPPRRDLPPPPPPPPPPDPDGDVVDPPPINIPPTQFEGLRIGGDKSIVPDEATKLEILRSGKDRIIGSYKLCITELGTVFTVSQLKSTGFQAYDERLIREMRGWRFRPYVRNGVEHSACTAYTFIYSAQ